MICSTLCFFTGTTSLLRSYQKSVKPHTKWTDLRGAAHRHRGQRGGDVVTAVALDLARGEGPVRRDYVAVRNWRRGCPSRSRGKAPGAGVHVGHGERTGIRER